MSKTTHNTERHTMSERNSMRPLFDAEDRPQFRSGMRVQWTQQGELYDRREWSGLVGRIVRKLDNLTEVDETDVGYVYEVDLSQGRIVHALESELMVR